MRLLSIALFGVIGIFCRYFIDLAMGQPQGFPWGTFLINLTGSFLAGAIYGLGVERSIIPLELRLPLMVGMMGGFTTFSAFSVQTLALIQSERIALAAAYALASPVLGTALAFAGLWVSRVAVR